MNSIGIRVSPQIIYFCTIVETETQFSFTPQTLVVPKALEVPESLAFIRTTMLTTIGKYGINRAGIRVYEGNTRFMDRFRMNIEGVIQELLANSTVDKYFTGTKQSLGSLLGVSVQEVSEIIDGKKLHCDLNDSNWLTYKTEQRESILTAFAALKL